MILLNLWLCFVLCQGVYSQGIKLPNGEKWMERSSSNKRRTCRNNGYCVSLRRCLTLRTDGNWRQKTTTCGSTSRTDRPKICCPPQTAPEQVVRTAVPDRGRSVSPSQTTCGVTRSSRKITPHVLGGEDAVQGSWPWMAAVMEVNRRAEDEYLCSGFLIDRRHVLSAAHCFDSTDASRYSVKIGNVEWIRGTKYTVEKVDIHEGYRPKLFYDDIAILKLSQEVNDPNVTPICLPYSLMNVNLVGNGVTVAGWGSLRSGGPMSDILQILRGIPVIANDRCQELLSTKLRSFNTQFPRGITRGFICAGFLEGGKDSCGGDSGGPLMILHEGHWTAVGIVSFGYDCGKPGYPAGYTRISIYLDWIRAHTSS